jgi:hypothetical protein
VRNLLVIPRIKQQEPFPKLEGGLRALHQIYEAMYPLSVSGEGYAQMVTTSEYQKGVKTFLASEKRRKVSLKWIKKFETLLSNSHLSSLDLNTAIRSDPVLLEEFERDWIDGCYTELLDPLGLAEAAIVWNWVIIKVSPETVEEDMGVSGKWHYDMHYPPSYFKAMFYLNDTDEHHSGTDFFDAETALAVSQRSEYVGLAFNRISDASLIATPEECEHIIEFRPHAGDAAIFWPCRVMHRGIYPKGKPRYSISLSFMPAQKLSLAQNKIHYKEALQHFVTGSDAAAYFLPKYELSLQQNLCLWDGTFSHAESSKLIIDAFRASVPPNASEEDKAAFDLIVHLVPLITKTDIDSLIQELVALCQNYFPYPNAQEFLFKYINSVQRDLARYHDPLAQEHAFWPDPTHEKYPRQLRHIKPFVTKLPILDKSTPIATAGSCFAFEISTVLQEQGYNYLIAERPDDPREGVIVNGYNPGDPYVRFSGNYGLLFNSPSLLRIAERAFGTREFKKLLVPEGDGFIDPYRENVYFRNQQAYLDDYPKHTEALRKILTETEVFVYTMGLNECWVYRDDKTAISRNPRANFYALVEHKRLTVQENVHYIEEFFRLCRRHNPKMKLILSVSPIPFLATGLSDVSHVVEANCHSKSVLRVAAQELVEKHEDIHYFPSFEMVMFTLDDPWESDLRHVKRDAVREVVNVFYEMYAK